MTTYEWRSRLADAELTELAASHGATPDPGWWTIARNHSLGWVTARSLDGLLVGFVNVAWDGRSHAFLLDTTTRGTHQRGGIGRELIRQAVAGARAAGCEWLHVDFEPHLSDLYLGDGGFRPTSAGLIHLRP